jgi:hypothetical protein
LTDATVVMPAKEGTRPCAPAQAVPRGYAAALWVLLSLFVLRVAGQALVAFLDVKFLPPMEAWYSGLLPYRWLLPSQLLIIALYGKICVDFSRGRGFSVIPRRRLGQGVLVVAGLYLGVMIVRYAVRMSLYPQERWTGGSIPTFFHWVLAAFLLLFGLYHWVRIRELQDFGHRPPPISWRSRTLWSVGVLIALGVMLWTGYQLAPLPRPELETILQSK